jgi:hypothetical protein
VMTVALLAAVRAAVTARRGVLGLAAGR